MSDKKEIRNEKPSYILELETADGQPSQEAFGSAVFYQAIKNTGDLEQKALEIYQYFVGKLWDQYGEEVWLETWKEVYTRELEAAGDISAELQGLSDFDVKLSATMLLENIENAEQAGIALAGAFDDPSVTELAVYAIGDSEAMSGLLIAAWRKKSRDATLLVFLMD